MFPDLQSDPSAFGRGDARTATVVPCPVVPTTTERTLDQPSASRDRTTTVLGVEILNVTMPRALDILDQLIQHREKANVYFVNADCLNLASRQPAYRDVLRATPYVFADGVGVRWASRRIGNEVVDNVNGTDLLPLLCQRSMLAGHRLFLLGGRPGVAEQAAANLRAQTRPDAGRPAQAETNLGRRRSDTLTPRLHIVGTQHGYFDHFAADESANVVTRINRARPDILLVAFGAPAQELWIARHHPLLECPIAMGVGGLFDFYSGRVPRAPDGLRRLGMEWCYRLWQEPRRLWRRYLLGNPLFVYRVLRHGRRSPGRSR